MLKSKSTLAEAIARAKANRERLKKLAEELAEEAEKIKTPVPLPAEPE